MIFNILSFQKKFSLYIKGDHAVQATQNENIQDEGVRHLLGGFNKKADVHYVCTFLLCCGQKFLAFITQ